MKILKFFLIILLIANSAQALEKLGPRLRQALIENRAGEYKVLICFQTTRDIEKNARTHRERLNILYNEGRVVQKSFLDSLNARNIKYNALPILNTVIVTLKKEDVLAAAERPEVLIVTLDFERKSIRPVPEEPESRIAASDIYIEGMIWSLKRLNVLNVWRGLGTDGTGVKVGVIDSGLNSTLDIFKDRVKEVVNTAVDPYSTDVTDESGHGTHVSGTVMGGVADNTVYEENFGIYVPKMKFKGNIGVAPGAELYFGKIFSGNSAAIADEIEALEWCATKEVRVVNASIGMDNPQQMPTLVPFYQNAMRTGMILVYAAGNESTKLGTPQDIPEIIAVGATDIHNNIADFSNYGPAQWGSKIYVKPDIAAPGVQVLSYYKDKLQFINGTSMAAPNATGVIALMIGIRPNITREQVQALLKKYCIDKGTPGPDIHFGYGIPDAELLCKAVYSTIPASEKLQFHIKNLKNFDSKIAELIRTRNISNSYYHYFQMRNTNIERILSLVEEHTFSSAAVRRALFENISEKDDGIPEGFIEIIEKLEEHDNGKIMSGM